MYLKASFVAWFDSEDGTNRNGISLIAGSFGFPQGSSPSVHGHFDFTRRASSTASSIFDLSYEADTLDRAIRDNDGKIVSVGTSVV